ncbi:MAG: alpha-amylase family glycosyl hydrolase, partial [Acidobacteriaceae bacterium]
GSCTRPRSSALVPLAQPPSPSWTESLIIYEIATKGFTSPNGPESGNFASLRAKLDYLEELGITGVWLTGYSLCDPHHFYNIWTQYAVIEPDKFDPTLGTAQQFHSLIRDAHDRGIRVFLDVITHGLMEDSPLVKAHPNWFRGSTWGMADFDWTGGHTDLDDWWVKVYTDFVTTYAVDGYRLDVAIYRPDLWERIRQNGAASGHPIVIWEEGNWVIPGVTDFTQRANVIGNTDSGDLSKVLVNDLPGFYNRKFGRTGYYRVEIEYADHTVVHGDTKSAGELGVRLVGLTADKVGRRAGDVPAKPDGLPDVQLRLDGVSQNPIENITVNDDLGQEWKLLTRGWQTHPIFVEATISSSSGPLVIGPSANIYIATLAWGASSVELSCHDNGWAGFPLDKNPYVAQGSRSIFGYSALFSPMIPIFFSGEEFDATFHASPGLSPDLYGGKNPGKGRWLYGNMLNWIELKESKHREMFNDVKKMIAIRKQYSEILSAWPDRREPNLKAIPYKSDIEVPVPYIRWSDRSAICIAGNRSIDQDANLKLRIPLKEIGFSGHAAYRFTDLWADGNAETYTETELKMLNCTVKKDKTSGGGISVFKIEPA